MVSTEMVMSAGLMNGKVPPQLFVIAWSVVYLSHIRHNLCLIPPTPIKAAGEPKNGNCHSVSCANLVETKHSAIGALAKGLQRVRDQHEMFRRDFLAGPPIDDGGRPYASHASCFGRSTEGVYDIVN